MVEPRQCRYCKFFAPRSFDDIEQRWQISIRRYVLIVFSIQKVNRYFNLFYQVAGNTRQKILIPGRFKAIKRLIDKLYIFFLHAVRQQDSFRLSD